VNQPATPRSGEQLQPAPQGLKSLCENSRIWPSAAKAALILRHLAARLKPCPDESDVLTQTLKPLHLGRRHGAAEGVPFPLGKLRQFLCALVISAAWCVALRAQSEQSARPPASELDRQNLTRVAASAAEIKLVLNHEAGLMVELKRWVARDATLHGQMVIDRDLADDAILERLETDLAFRSVATSLLQHYGYLVPRINPNSEFGRQRQLLIEERAKWLAQSQEEARSEAQRRRSEELEAARACQAQPGAECKTPATRPAPGESPAEESAPAEPAPATPSRAPGERGALERASLAERGEFPVDLAEFPAAPATGPESLQEADYSRAPETADGAGGGSSAAFDPFRATPAPAVTRAPAFRGTELDSFPEADATEEAGTAGPSSNSPAAPLAASNAPNAAPGGAPIPAKRRTAPAELVR